MKWISDAGVPSAVSWGKMNVTQDKMGEISKLMVAKEIKPVINSKHEFNDKGNKSVYVKSHHAKGEDSC